MNNLATRGIAGSLILIAAVLAILAIGKLVFRTAEADPHAGQSVDVAVVSDPEFTNEGEFPIGGMINSSVAGTLDFTSFNFTVVALADVDVGIAIGAGTDIAIESADIVLVSDRLSSVVDAYYIGKSSFRKTLQNVSLAFGFNGIGVPAAVTGFVRPVFAMIAMAASVSTVLLNSFGGQLSLGWSSGEVGRRTGGEVRLRHRESAG